MPKYDILVIKVSNKYIKLQLVKTSIILNTHWTDSERMHQDTVELF